VSKIAGADQHREETPSESTSGSRAGAVHRHLGRKRSGDQEFVDVEVFTRVAAERAAEALGSVLAPE
jgi:hypothetical protein